MSKNRNMTILMILAAIVLTASIWYCYNVDNESDIEQTTVLKPTPDVWTPELEGIYNESDPIEFLEYHPNTKLTINNETKTLKKFVIVTIPGDMENRASFRTYNDTATWTDEDIIVGDNTKTFTTQLNAVYVFADENVSNALYERIELYLYGRPFVKVVRIDLSE